MAALTLRWALGSPMGLGIMRQCLETRTLDQLGERLALLGREDLLHQSARHLIHLSIRLGLQTRRLR